MEDVLSQGIEQARAPRTEKLPGCPLCFNQTTREYFAVEDRNHGVPGKFAYDRCLCCDSVFQNPMVIDADLGLCYPPDYVPYDFSPEMPVVEFENGDSSFRQRIRNSIVASVKGVSGQGVIGLIGKLLSASRAMRERAFYGIVIDECIPRSNKTKNALDVGCGAGWMLERLGSIGWNVEGVEWDAKAATIAGERTGKKVWAGDFREIELENGRYGLIFLSHVFEHFHDPKGALRRFWELLEERGKLVLIYPNPNAFDARWFKENWFAWEAPRHLILPSARVMAELAAGSGFAQPRIRSRVASHLWTKSLAYELGFHPEKGPPPLRFSHKVGLLIQRIMNSLGWKAGSELIVVMEKAELEHR